MRICNFFCPIFYFKRQSCSRLFSVVRHLVAATFCLYTSFAVFSQVNTDAYSQPQSQAQSMPTMPSLPSIQSVTMPSLGTDFYSPKNPSLPAKPTSPNASQSNSARSSAASSAVPAASNAAPATTTTATTSPVSATSNSTALSALAGNGNFAGVSAADMMLLDRAGLLNSLPADLTINNLSIAQNGMANENANKKVLENILTELNELKAQVAAIGNGSAEKSDVPVATSANGASVRVSASHSRSAMHSKNDNAQILRFVVNGYDMKSSCRTVYFSERGADGTFLMTADRRYMSDNISRTETFYLLFKSKGTTDNGIEYDVIPSVIQDYENQYSFLYQLAQKQNLSAAKTGNLVTLRVTEPNWNMDLLLDISDTVRN